MDSTMMYLHVKKIGNESVDPVKNLSVHSDVYLVCVKKLFFLKIRCLS